MIEEWFSMPSARGLGLFPNYRSGPAGLPYTPILKRAWMKGKGEITGCQGSSWETPATLETASKAPFAKRPAAKAPVAKIPAAKAPTARKAAAK
jgi:hypothetical protein